MYFARLAIRSDESPEIRRASSSGFIIVVDLLDPVAGLGDELGLFVGEVFAVGGLDDSVDELLPLLDLRDVAGKHLIGCAHIWRAPFRLREHGNRDPCSSA